MDSPEGGWYEWLFVRLVIFGTLWEIFNELFELLCEAGHHTEIFALEWQRVIPWCPP